MKPYKGIIRISCCDKTCHRKLIQPEAGCLNCVHGTVEILDLEGNILETFNRPACAAVAATSRRRPVLEEFAPVPAKRAKLT